MCYITKIWYVATWKRVEDILHWSDNSTLAGQFSFSKHLLDLDDCQRKGKTKDVDASCLGFISCQKQKDGRPEPLGSPHLLEITLCRCGPYRWPFLLRISLWGCRGWLYYNFRWPNDKTSSLRFLQVPAHCKGRLKRVFQKWIKISWPTRLNTVWQRPKVHIKFLRTTYAGIRGKSENVFWPASSDRWLYRDHQQEDR